MTWSDELVSKEKKAKLLEEIGIRRVFLESRGVNTIEDFKKDSVSPTWYTVMSVKTFAENERYCYCIKTKAKADELYRLVAWSATERGHEKSNVGSNSHTVVDDTLMDSILNRLDELLYYRYTELWKSYIDKHYQSTSGGGSSVTNNTTVATQSSNVTINTAFTASSISSGGSQPNLPVYDINASGRKKTVLCSFFKFGKCKHGDNCNFSHDINLLQSSSSITSSLSSPAVAVLQSIPNSMVPKYGMKLINYAAANKLENLQKEFFDVYDCSNIINYQEDVTRRTALMYACHQGNVEVVKLLLNHNADTDVKSSNDFTALKLAISAGHYHIAELFKNNSNTSNSNNSSTTSNNQNQSGTDTWARVPSSTASAAATSFYRPPHINNNNNNNIPSSSSSSLYSSLPSIPIATATASYPSAIAANSYNVSDYPFTSAPATKKVTTMNVNKPLPPFPSAQATDGDMLIYYAIINDISHIKSMLKNPIVDYRSFINTMDKDGDNGNEKGGKTALMHASIREHLDIVKLLVEAGADIDLIYRNTNFKAVDLAKQRQNNEIVNYLEYVAALKATKSLTVVSTGGGQPYLGVSRL